MDRFFAPSFFVYGLVLTGTHYQPKYMVPKEQIMDSETFTQTLTKDHTPSDTENLNPVIISPLQTKTLPAKADVPQNNAPLVIEALPTQPAHIYDPPSATYVSNLHVFLEKMTRVHKFAHSISEMTQEAIDSFPDKTRKLSPDAVNKVEKQLIEEIGKLINQATTTLNPHV